MNVTTLAAEIMTHEQAASLLGMSVQALTTAYTLGYAPRPDGRWARSPVWRRTTIERYAEERAAGSYDRSVAPAANRIADYGTRDYAPDAALRPWPLMILERALLYRRRWLRCISTLSPEVAEILATMLREQGLETKVERGAARDLTDQTTNNQAWWIMTRANIAPLRRADGYDD